MKLKFDFVTNSSSTSFCAWGLSFYYEDCEEGEYFLPEELLRNAYDNYIAYCQGRRRKGERITYSYGDVDENHPLSFEDFYKKITEFEYFYTDFISSYLQSFDIDSIFFYEGQGVYLGRSPFGMKEDETLSDFKYNLKQDLMKAGFSRSDVQYLDGISEDVYY